MSAAVLPLTPEASATPRALRSVTRLTGSVEVVDGCLRLREDDATPGILLLWPPDFRLVADGDDLQLRAAFDSLVGTVGQEIRVSGTFLPGDTDVSRYIPEADRCLEGPYFFVVEAASISSTSTIGSEIELH